MPGKRQCPYCGDDLERIQRRLVDRAIGVWSPVRRYQCRNPLCSWVEGNLEHLEMPMPPIRRLWIHSKPRLKSLIYGAIHKIKEVPPMRRLWVDRRHKLKSFIYGGIQKIKRAAIRK